MTRRAVGYSWDEEVELWKLLVIKKEAVSRIPAHFEFDENGVIYQVTYRSGRREMTNGTWITEHRVRKAKKRFPELNYSGWTELPDALKKVHPKYTEYRKEEAAQSQATTPVQEKAWSRCRDRDHDWMIPYSEFDNVAFERIAWIEGDTVLDMICCYFCGYAEIRKDEGGVPFFSGPLQKKPESIPERVIWITITNS